MGASRIVVDGGVAVVALSARDMVAEIVGVDGGVKDFLAVSAASVANKRSW